MGFYLIILSMIAGDVGFAAWAWRRLRRLPKAMLWRAAMSVFLAVQAGYMLWFIIDPSGARHRQNAVPTMLIAVVYLWHLILLPVSLLMMASHGIAISANTAFRSLRWPAAPRQEESTTDPITRRQLLGATAAALPPLIAIGAGAGSMLQLGSFRIRPMHIGLVNLPRDLEGMTIAHVTDTHVGRYTHGQTLIDIAETTNRLKADLVLMTGDLINMSLTDLPEALEMLGRFDPRHGLYLCEGNHDLIDSRQGFESGMKRSPYSLLLDESATVRVRGVPIQLLGLRWMHGEQGIDESMRQLHPRRDPDAWQILMAHHPHAFDAAVEAGIPLTLAGHTHGGQLMVTPNIGFGPLMFRYWSGLYRKNDHALVVSNGVGNWFPLRTCAPAEIVHITLHRSAA